MRHKIIYCALIIGLFVVACSDSSLEYERGYEAGYSDGVSYVEDKYYDKITYYEALCDELGYLTYEGAYEPWKWKYYVNDTTWHTNWLCSDFDNSANYYVSANTVFLEQGISPCSKCAEDTSDICYLDTDSGRYYTKTSKLHVGTTDYISQMKVYEIATINSALENGYLLAEEE